MVYIPEKGPKKLNEQFKFDKEIYIDRFLHKNIAETDCLRQLVKELNEKVFISLSHM